LLTEKKPFNKPVDGLQRGPNARENRGNTTGSFLLPRKKRVGPLIFAGGKGSPSVAAQWLIDSGLMAQ